MDFGVSVESTGEKGDGLEKRGFKGHGGSFDMTAGCDWYEHNLACLPLPQQRESGAVEKEAYLVKMRQRHSVSLHLRPV